MHPEVAFHPQGGLDEVRVNKLWCATKYLSGFALLARVCMQSYTMCKKELYPPDVKSIVNSRMLNKFEALFWLYVVLFSGLRSILCVRCPRDDPHAEPHASTLARYLRLLPRRPSRLLALRAMLNAAASWSALKFLVFMTVPGLLNYWKQHESNAIFKKVPKMLFAVGIGFCAMIYMPIGLAVFQLKLEQVSFATDWEHKNFTGWSLSDAFSLIAFANQVISVISEGEVRLNTALNFGFARSDAQLQPEEADAKNKYEVELCNIIRRSSVLNPMQKLLLVLTYDSEDLQQLLIDERVEYRPPP